MIDCTLHIALRTVDIVRRYAHATLCHVTSSPHNNINNTDAPFSLNHRLMQDKTHKDFDTDTPEVAWPLNDATFEHLAR